MPDRPMLAIYTSRALTSDGAEIVSRFYIDHFARVLAARAGAGLVMGAGIPKAA